MRRFGIALICLSALPIGFIALALVFGIVGIGNVAGIAMDLAWLTALVSPFALVGGILLVIFSFHKRQPPYPRA